MFFAPSDLFLVIPKGSHIYAIISDYNGIMKHGQTTMFVCLFFVFSAILFSFSVTPLLVIQIFK